MTLALWIATILIAANIGLLAAALAVACRDRPPAPPAHPRRRRTVR